MNGFRLERIFIFLLVVFLFSCQRENVVPVPMVKTTDVSIDVAKQVALNLSNRENFFQKGTRQNSRSSSSIPGFEEKEIDEIIVIPGEDGSPLLYVVKFLPDGYVIVSATKKESPILGYSENAIFEFSDLPYGIAVWLIDKMDKIQILKSADSLHIPDEIEAEWAQMVPPEDGGGEGGGEVVVSGGVVTEQKGPLLTTRWRQWNGYNTLLDPINGQLPPTGCVATAMAQVMRYHQFPTSYNWSAMPDTVGTIETAQLMKNIGQAVGMNYSLSGSGASMDNARDALVNTFGYSSSAQYIDYDVNTVVYELASNRPVMLDAYHTYYTTTSGWWIFAKTTHHYEDGHTWVSDGYQLTSYISIHNPGTVYEYTTTTNNGYFLHMNWGWGVGGMGPSDNNGWFKCDNFVVSNGNSYQYRKRSIVGIKP